MKQSVVTLPRIKLECLRCRHLRKEATPMWDRGHLLMKRGTTTVFARDDLCYLFGKSLQDVVVPLLQAIGYSGFGDNCPRCGHGHAQVIRSPLSPANYRSETIACTDLDESDFVKVGPIWQLRPEAEDALTR